LENGNNPRIAGIIAAGGIELTIRLRHHRKLNLG